MAVYRLKRSKAKSLEAQIRAVERQVQSRRRGIDDRMTTLIRKLHQGMTAPTTLLLATGLGFVLGKLTQRRVSNSPGASSGKPKATGTPALMNVLSLIASARALYTALPVAWMIKSLKRRVKSRETPERQIQPVLSGKRGRPRR